MQLWYLFTKSKWTSVEFSSVSRGVDGETEAHVVARRLRAHRFERNNRIKAQYRRVAGCGALWLLTREGWNPRSYV